MEVGTRIEMGLQRVSPTFPQISLLLRRQLTLISTRHRRQHHRQQRQQRHHRQHHPSDSAALIISFLWPMFLASRMQTAFCDFVTVIGHINLCSRTALEQLLPATAKNRAATVAASAASCPMSDTRCPMSSVHCPPVLCPLCLVSGRIQDAQTANFLSPSAMRKPQKLREKNVKAFTTRSNLLQVLVANCGRFVCDRKIRVVINKIEIACYILKYA